MVVERVRLECLMLGDEIVDPEAPNGMLYGLRYDEGGVALVIDGVEYEPHAAQEEVLIERPTQAPAREQARTRVLRVGVREDPDLADTLRDITRALAPPQAARITFDAPAQEELLVRVLAERQGVHPLLAREAIASVALDQDPRAQTQSLEGLEATKRAELEARTPDKPKRKRKYRVPARVPCTWCQRPTVPGAGMARHVKTRHPEHWEEYRATLDADTST